jgi:hypothetical protein
MLQIKELKVTAVVLKGISPSSLLNGNPSCFFLLGWLFMICCSTYDLAFGACI